MPVSLQVAERYYASFEAGDFDAARECFAPECVTVTPAGTMDPADHEAFGRAFKSGLPDAHMEIVKAVEAGDEVFIEGRFKGNHTGDLATAQGEIPASGNTLDLPFADYFRVENGAHTEPSPTGRWRARPSPVAVIRAASAAARSGTPSCSVITAATSAVVRG